MLLRLCLLLYLFSTLYAKEQGELEDFTNIFSIRSLQNGVLLSVKQSSGELIAQNWKLREVVLIEKLKRRDPFREKLPFGTVQFVDPTYSDNCLAIDETGFFVGKSCKEDLEKGALETVFSIMPTNTSAVQIRSLVLNANECITTFENPNLPIEKRFGILNCSLDTQMLINPARLFIFTPPLIKAKVL